MVSFESEFWKSVKGFFKYLFRPAWWSQNHPFSRGLDERINKAIDSGAEAKVLNSHECSFDGLRLWMANHPYASCRYRGLMPRRATRERLMNYIIHNEGRSK